MISSKVTNVLPWLMTTPKYCEVKSITELSMVISKTTESVSVSYDQ